MVLPSAQKDVGFFSTRVSGHASLGSFTRKRTDFVVGFAHRGSDRLESTFVNNVRNSRWVDGGR
jgi:hypothetical protein